LNPNFEHFSSPLQSMSIKIEAQVSDEKGALYRRLLGTSLSGTVSGGSR
jgi:hypothetical protein